jgi:hypothetical protein
MIKKKKKKKQPEAISRHSGAFKPFSIPQLTRSLSGAKDRGAYCIPSDEGQKTFEKTYLGSALFIRNQEIDFVRSQQRHPYLQ